jgi:hypothetical protein
VTLALHPDLDELSFLLGTWRGEGEGSWPGAEDFAFTEEATFEHAGDAWLVYRQRSWSREDGAAIHFERGFVRPAGAGRVELVLAHPIGVAEIAEGTVRDGVLDVASSSVGVSGTASEVTELRRRLEVDGDVLTYELHMAMREIPLTSHIRSRLARG